MGDRDHMDYARGRRQRFFFVFFKQFLGENAATTHKILEILSALKKMPCSSCFLLEKSNHFSQDAVKIGAAPRRIILMVLKPRGIGLIKSYDQNRHARVEKL